MRFIGAMYSMRTSEHKSVWRTGYDWMSLFLGRGGTHSAECEDTENRLKKTVGVDFDEVVEYITLTVLTVWSTSLIHNVWTRGVAYLFT